MDQQNTVPTVVPAPAIEPQASGYIQAAPVQQPLPPDQALTVDNFSSVDAKAAEESLDSLEAAPAASLTVAAPSPTTQVLSESSNSSLEPGSLLPPVEQVALAPKKKFSLWRQSTSSRLLMRVIAISAITFILLAGIGLLIRRYSSTKVDTRAAVVQDQAVELEEATPGGIRVVEDSHTLIVNGNLLTTGTLKITNGQAQGQLRFSNTSGQTYNLPNASGTFCLDTNNCGFARPTDITPTSIAGASGALNLGAGLSLAGNTINNTVTAGLPTTLNGFGTAITLQGTANQITVTNSNGTITLTTPQDIATTSSPAFNTITLATVGTQNGNIICDNSNNCGYAGGGAAAFVQNGNTFGVITNLGTNDNFNLVLETNNVARLTLDTSGNATLAGGQLRVADGTAVAPSHTFTSDTDTGLYLSAANVLGVAVGGVQRLTLDNSGNATLAGGQLRVADGTAALPSITFTIDTDTGLYRSAANVLGVGVGGVQTALFNNAGRLTLGNDTASPLSGSIQLHDSTGANGFTSSIGTAALSANRTITFPNQTGTVCLTSGNCIGSGGAGDVLNGGNTYGIPMVIGTDDNFTLGLETNGTTRFTINSSGQLLASGGNVSTPTYSFTADSDTGFYYDGNSTIGLSFDGSQRIFFAPSRISVVGDVYADSQIAVGESSNLSSNAIGIFRSNLHSSLSSTHYAVDAERLNNASANSTATLMGGRFQTGVVSGNTFDHNIYYGLQGQVTHGGTGSMALARGVVGTVVNSSSGTITSSSGLVSELANAGTVTTWHGARILNPTNTGTLTTNYGIKVDNQTSGTADYGIVIDGADTQALWVGAGSDYTTANQGISFGASRDISLYRNGTNGVALNGSLSVTRSDASATAALVDGAAIFTFSDTGVVTSGIDTSTAQTIQVTRTGATGGTINTTGLNIGLTVDGAGAGVATARGIQIGTGLGVSPDFLYGIDVMLLLGSNGVSSEVVGVRSRTDSFFFAGSVTDLIGLQADVNISTSGVATNAYGLQILSATDAPSNGIVNNYGIQVKTQTTGSTSNYGIAVETAGTQTLWVSSDADNTTANAGIAFGLSRDTNLYRLTANTLRTDDSFVALGHGAFGNASANSSTTTLNLNESTVATNTVGISNILTSTATIDGATVVGNYNQITSNGSNNYSLLGGNLNAVSHSSSGTLGELYGLTSSISNDGAGIVTLAAGMNIGEIQNSGAGSIQTAIGLLVGEQTQASSGFGVVLQGASTQALWVGAAGAYTTANQGIAFGSARDTNLYRSAANTLRTDTALSVGTTLTVGTLGTADTTTLLCRNTTNQLAGCNTSGTGAAFVQGGNDFGTTATIGTTTLQSLQFTANNSVRFILDGTSGALQASGGSQFRGASGSSASTPAFAFNSDTNTGLFNPSASVLGVTISGAEVARFAGSAFQIGSTGSAGMDEKFRVNTPGTVDNDAAAIISAGASDQHALIVQGAGSQSINLQEWQDSTGAVLASVSSSGNLTVVNASVTGTLVVTNAATFNNTLTVNGHIITGNTSGTTSVTVDTAGAGTGASASISGNDTSGVITINTGTGAGAGTLATVTFANAYGSTPQIVITPKAIPGSSAYPQYHFDSTTTTFDLRTYNALTDSSTYTFTYLVTQ